MVVREKVAFGASRLVRDVHLAVCSAIGMEANDHVSLSTARTTAAIVQIFASKRQISRFGTNSPLSVASVKT